MFFELMASKLYGVTKVRNTKKNAWCLQWNMVVAVSLCGAAWVLLVSGSCISLMASWIHKCTALYWKRRSYHHPVPLVVMHFSNMTMILNTHLMALFHCMVRYGSARLGTVRLSSGRFAFPLQFSTAIEWAGLFTRRYNCAASTAVTSS